MRRGPREISVRAVGEFSAVESVRELIVATTRDGSAVRLRDVAREFDSFAEMRTRIRVNGEEAVALEVVKQSGRNTVEIADAVRARLAELEKTFPAGMKTWLIINQSALIRENAHEVEIAIVSSGVMAILASMLFMLDLSSTIISALACRSASS